MSKQDRQEKYYNAVIKNCKECPFWLYCPNQSYTREDHEFPDECLLEDWKYIRKFR